MDVSSRSGNSGRRANSASSIAPITRRSSRSDQAAAAAASLALLLREDPLLEQYGLTEAASTSAADNKVAFPYAAALLQGGEDDDDHTTAKQRADLALQDVERKLTLVESLAVKLSRTSPEAVAGHLLRLHGYHVREAREESKPDGEEGQITSATTTNATTTTLQAIRQRAERLERQADTLEGVALRVEGSLSRGLVRMEATCTRLERVLSLSSTLKMILRLQFENSKLVNYDLEDLRDLTRAAASVAVVEDLLSAQKSEIGNSIAVVERMRPQIEATAAAVRRAASALLKKQDGQSIQQLGATLQVYYHLGELPGAVWKAVDDAHAKAEAVCRQLWNPVTLANINDEAKKTAKEARLIPKKLKELRAEAAQQWADGIADASTQIRNLQRVLTVKTDQVRRQVYIDVVANAPVPAEYADFLPTIKPFSLFALFWARFCRSLATTISNVLHYEQGKMVSEVAALYPAVRAVSLEMISRLQGTLLSSSTANVDDFFAGSTVQAPGVLGGSAALDDGLLEWKMGQEDRADNPQSAASADTWTKPPQDSGQRFSQRLAPTSVASATSLSSVFQSREWKELQGGSGKTQSGFHQLERAFLEKCKERLNTPLQYIFPENVALGDDGIPISTGTALLPSKYDIQRFDENIRQELSLADPREGGGDVSSVTMIAECVVAMICEFCVRAKNATTGCVGENGYLGNNWTMAESLQHDRKVVAIMYTLAQYLRNAPEKTFVAPYRPSTSPQHEEAAMMCQAALAPAVDAIEKMVKSVVLNPLCRALNRQIANGVLAKVHHGVYLEDGKKNDDADDSPAFVQKHLEPVFDLIAKNFLAKFPPPYAAVIGGNVAAYTIYTFISSVSLVRPLGEWARLHITQDLADLEMALEQFVGKAGSGSLLLSQIEGGRPYAELRAVRQMLFWSGLETKTSTATDIAKALLREVWMKDVRPSTVIHYLVSYAPSLLSSPQHMKRMKAEDYVSTLVQLDASVEAGETDSWMTTVACCDAYQQRASTAGSITDGDPRITQIIMILGQELIRRQQS